MIINLDSKYGVDLRTIRVGDIIGFADGSCYLIISDYDGNGFRAVDLAQNKSTEWCSNIPDLIRSYIGKTPIEIFRADEITLGRI